MQLEKLSLAIYPRTSWQAVDLGCQLAMRWWSKLTGFWLCVTLPVFIVCMLVSVEWGGAIFWLLKPWYERGLLFILSREVFGENVSITQAVKALPGEIKPLWFSSISWRRLSPYRGFNLPVSQLEQLTGEVRAKRLNTLHRTSDDNSLWWFVLCSNWELIIVLGLVTLVGFLVPQGVQMSWDSVMLWDSHTQLLVYNVLYYLAVLVVAPFFISGSFVAYLNRRVNLEGWDIELNFKNMTKRLMSRTSNLVVGILFGTVLFSATPSPLAAAEQISNGKAEQVSSEQYTEQQNELENESQNESQKIVQQQLEEILSNPPFKEDIVVKRTRWTGWEFPEYEAEEESDSSINSTFLAFIVSIIEYLVWGVFILILLTIFWLSKDSIAALFNRSTESEASQIEIPSFVGKMSPQNSHLNSSKDLLDLLQSGSFRTLLSILLVKSLMKLQGHYDLELKESMTERECLLAIEKVVAKPLFIFMTDLINTWTRLAWAHKLPELNQVTSLYNSWVELFDNESEGPNEVN